MDKNNYPRAKQVLRALIQGVDPETSGELPKDTVLNRVDVVRALLSSVDAIEQVTARQARRALLPSGVGQHWTEDEEQRLKEAFANGDAIPDIAQRHNRTVRAIEARLERIGLLTADQRTTNNSFTGSPRKDEP
jgi:DNA-binding NarL/FixJ family response regulator